MLVIRDVCNKIILESITSPSVSGRAITSQAWAAEGERTPCTETTEGQEEQNGKYTGGPG